MLEVFQKKKNKKRLYFRWYCKEGKFPTHHRLTHWVCLDRTYFAETEN